MTKKKVMTNVVVANTFEDFVSNVKAMMARQTRVVISDDLKRLPVELIGAG